MASLLEHPRRGAARIPFRRLSPSAAMKFAHIPGVYYPGQDKPGTGRFSRVPGVWYPPPDYSTKRATPAPFTRCTTRQFTAEDRAKIVRLYHDGVWILHIAAMYHVGRVRIASLLKEAGVDIRRGPFTAQHRKAA